MNDASRTDPATDLTMPRGGRYAGQPMDVSSRRSVHIVDDPTHSGRRPAPSAGLPTAAAASDVAPEMVVDFFYHLGQYWRAHVPRGAAERIVGQAFNFSRPKTRSGPNGPEIVYAANGLPRRTIPCLNHVQSRFICHAHLPVRLFPVGSDDAAAGQEVHRLYDFVASAEAVGPAGVKFNLRDALLGNFVTAHRFVSTEEMVFERIVVQNQYLVQSPPLPVTPEIADELLYRAIYRSHRAGMIERYRLYHPCGTNNCTSSPLQILDEVVAYSGLHRLGSWLYRLPVSPRFYLRARGLYDRRQAPIQLRTEFADYIAAPTTQQRKRDFVRTQVRAERAARAAARNT